MIEVIQCVVHTGFGLWYQTQAPSFKGDFENLSNVKAHPDEMGMCGSVVIYFKGLWCDEWPELQGVFQLE